MTTMVRPVPLAEPFRPHTPDYLADPYRHLAELRAMGPCVIDPGTGLWFLLGYEHVAAGLSQIVRGHPDGPDRRPHFKGNPFAADGPPHAGPRRVIVPTFTNRAVNRFRDRAQAIVDDVIDPKGDGAELRVVGELGFRLPYTLTCELLGVPDVEASREDLRVWTWKCQQLLDPFLPDDELRDCMAASAELAGHLGEVLEWKRDHLGDDLLSTILNASDDGSVLRSDQVLAYVHTLYLAGMHTTVNQIALMLRALMNQRDQWELLRADPTLLDGTVEEALRFEPTAQFMRRTTETEVDIHGVRIPPHTGVVCWIASANRDEARWGDSADRLDIRRPDARSHVAFGFGPHVCIGAWLARLELQIVLRALVERFPNTTMPAQQVAWDSVALRGPEELVLELKR
jgi:cytochrome P450